MAHDTHGASHARALPADLSAPAFVDGWRSRAFVVGAVAAVVAVILAFSGNLKTISAGTTSNARGCSALSSPSAGLWVVLLC